MLGMKLFSTPPPTQKIPAQRELSTAPTHKGCLIPKHNTTSMTGHVYKTRESKPNHSKPILKSPKSQSSHFILTFHQISILNFSLWKIWAQDFPFLLPAHFSRKCNLQSSQLPGLTSLALQKPHLVLRMNPLWNKQKSYPSLYRKDYDFSSLQLSSLLVIKMIFVFFYFFSHW